MLPPMPSSPDLLSLSLLLPVSLSPMPSFMHLPFCIVLCLHLVCCLACASGHCGKTFICRLLLTPFSPFGLPFPRWHVLYHSAYPFSVSLSFHLSPGCNLCLSIIQMCLSLSDFISAKQDSAVVLKSAGTILLIIFTYIARHFYLPCLQHLLQPKLTHTEPYAHTALLLSPTPPPALPGITAHSSTWFVPGRFAFAAVWAWCPSHTHTHLPHAYAWETVLVGMRQDDDRRQACWRGRFGGRWAGWQLAAGGETAGRAAAWWQASSQSNKTTDMKHKTWHKTRGLPFSSMANIVGRLEDMGLLLPL